MKVYLSGPMTGKPELNFPTFHTAAAAWRAKGHEVTSPAENFEGRTDLARAQYMRLDIEQVLTAEAVVVLPGWQESKGAALEVVIAQEIGLPLYDVSGEMVMPESCLEEAQRLVYGERGGAYGHPYNDYLRVAKIWSVILGVEVTPEKACLCMIGVKLSREINKHKRDNLVDIAGYAECVNRIVEAI